MAKIGAGAKAGIKRFKAIYALIAFIMIGVFIGTFMLVQKVVQTEQYYVLNQDVPTRTQITPEMLSPVTTSEGTGPAAALTIADVQQGYMYTKYPLSQGDILTNSNVGGYEDISVGIPDGWLVTNFQVDADSAVGGRITRGTYFDIMVVTNNGSFYPFVNVLALDTTVSMSGASSANAANTEEAHSGQTTQYVVGMPPQDAAKLHQIVKKYNGAIKLTLSPRENEYKTPNLSAYSGVFAQNNNDLPKDMGRGTDYTFTPVKRDTYGQPTETPQDCSKGNAKIGAEKCAEANKKNTNPDETTTTSPSATPTK